MQADEGSWTLSEERGALFVNPGRPISPETMAVHHIIEEYVADAPLWKLIAPEVLQPQHGVAALAAHRAASSSDIARLVYRVALHGFALEMRAPALAASAKFLELDAALPANACGAGA